MPQHEAESAAYLRVICPSPTPSEGLSSSRCTPGRHQHTNKACMGLMSCRCTEPCHAAQFLFCWAHLPPGNRPCSPAAHMQLRSPSILPVKHCHLAMLLQEPHFLQVGHSKGQFSGKVLPDLHMMYTIH